MMCPFPFEPKISGATSAATSGLLAAAFNGDAGPKSGRTSAELKRSFASMLGPVQKAGSRPAVSAQPDKPVPGENAPHQGPPAADMVKSKSTQPTRSTATATRASATRNPEARVADSGEPESPTDFSLEEQEDAVETPLHAEVGADVVAPGVPPPLPIGELPPVGLGVCAAPPASAPVEAEAVALAVEDSSPQQSQKAVGLANASALNAGLSDEGARASGPAASAGWPQNDLGREAALAAEEASAQPSALIEEHEEQLLNNSTVTDREVVNAAGEPATSRDAVGAFKLPTGLNPVATQLDPRMASAPVSRALRAEKTAAAASTTLAGGQESVPVSVFNNIEKTTDQLVKKVDGVVGPTSANSNSNMSSPLLDFTATSSPDAAATEAVARVNLVDVVDEVAAITEQARISGSHRCVVDLDVSGHGKLRVEVVRRADQLETVLSTDSVTLRESLQAALERSDRPNNFSASLQWSGAPDTSGRGQNGAQADADARQNLYFKAEPAARVGRITSAPVVPVDPVAAPVLAAQHRLQIFA